MINEVYKRSEFEDTCTAIWDGLNDGTIELPEDSDFHHDDVFSIEKWVEATAEDLHREHVS